MKQSREKIGIVTKGFLRCNEKRYTVLCTPPIEHPDTFVRRLLRLQRELRTQSRFHLSRVLRTPGWHSNRLCAHCAGVGFWDYHSLVPIVCGRRGCPARNRGSRHATDTYATYEDNDYGVADLDTGEGGTRLVFVSSQQKAIRTDYLRSYEDAPL